VAHLVNKKSGGGGFSENPAVKKKQVQGLSALMMEGRRGCIGTMKKNLGKKGGCGEARFGDFRGEGKGARDEHLGVEKKKRCSVRKVKDKQES